jgi:hypothetical protein
MEIKVPRYHFNLKCKETKIPDERGQVLNSSWDACIRAQEIISQCLQYTEIEDEEQWLIGITNDVGEAEIVVLFPRQLPGRSLQAKR